MFSQVVSTILRLTVAHADRWRSVTASHDVPIYGFERQADPPPLAIDVPRLLDEFARGLLTAGDTWATMLPAEEARAVERLAGDAAEARDAATRPDTPESEPRFAFPDDVWARVIYGVALTAKRGTVPMERMVAALVPIYYGRVASLVIETRDMTTEAAEVVVERQASAFEQAKASFVRTWEAEA